MRRTYLHNCETAFGTDSTLSSSTGGPIFTLSGRSAEPVIEELEGGYVHVGLPALAIRIEPMHLAVLLAADEGRLGCHHASGVEGVVPRFVFSVIHG